MKKPRRKSAKTDNPTRQLLIEETSRRVEEFGVDGVDIDAVLSKLKVSKGALYHYFGSINELLTAGLLHAYKNRMEEAKIGSLALATDFKSAKEVRERLYKAVDSYHHVPARNPLRSLRMQAYVVAQSQPTLALEIGRIQAELTEAFTIAVRELQRRGWVRGDMDPRAFSVLFQALNQGRAIDDIVTDADRVNPESWIAIIRQVIDHMLFGDD